MHILIVGNSVSEKSEGNTKAYPDLLERSFEGEIQVSRIIRGGNTICDMEASVVNALQRIVPLAMILQTGHVDCAPRPLTRRERKKLSGLRPKRLRLRIIRFIHDYRPQITRLRGLIQFAPLPAFRESVSRIVTKATSLNCFVSILPINRVGLTYETHVPWFNREIERYNSTLYSFSSWDKVRYVEQAELLANMTPDDYCLSSMDLHFTSLAHKEIAQYLEEQIWSILMATDQSGISE